MPECTSRSPTRTVIEACTNPRPPTVIAGVRSSAISESNTIAQSASSSPARRRSSTERLPISSSPSTRKRTFTGSSPSRASSQATCSSGRKLPLSSAAPRAYRRPSRSVGSNAGLSQASSGPGACTS